MQNWMRQDTPIMRGFSTLADLALLNLLWLVCSLPIFTIGASSAALYQCLFSLECGEGGGGRAFFRAFRDAFQRATLLWLMVLLSGIVLVTDYRLTIESSFVFRGVLIAAYVAITLLCLCSLVFLFVPPALSASSIPRALKTAFLLGVANLPRTILVLLLWSIPFVWMITATRSFWHFLWIWIGFGFSGIAYLSAKLFRKPLRIAEH